MQYPECKAAGVRGLTPPLRLCYGLARKQPRSRTLGEAERRSVPCEELHSP